MSNDKLEFQHEKERLENTKQWIAAQKQVIADLKSIPHRTPLRNKRGTEWDRVDSDHENRGKYPQFVEINLSFYFLCESSCVISSHVISFSAIKTMRW